MPINVIHAAAESYLATVADDTFDAVVTDPPYGLTGLDTAKVSDTLGRWLTDDPWFIPDGTGLVGRHWDRFVPPPGLWAEVLRVVKPGGHALVFAWTRTMDLMGMSCRLAGFDVREDVFLGSDVSPVRGARRAVGAR